MPIDFAPEFGTKFTLTGPDGTVATFNDLTDTRDVGVLTDLTGLDSAEVRDSGEDIVEFDGAVQGPNWFGSRPIVLEGLVYGHTSAEARAAKIARLDGATKALRDDAILTWTPSVTNAVPVFLRLRRQQRLSVTGPWNKTFQAPMVARDPRIYSVEEFNVSTFSEAPLTVTNEGNAEAFPLYTLFGPSTDEIVISNQTTGLNIVTSAALDSSDVLVVDTLRRTVMAGARSTAPTRRNFFPNPNFQTSFSGGCTAVGATVGLGNPPMTGPSVGQPGTDTGQVTALRVSPTGTTGEAFARRSDAVPTVAPGQTVRTAISFLSNAVASVNFFIRYVWKNSGGTTISTSSSTPESVITTLWKRTAFDAVAPATTDSVDVEFVFTGDHGVVGTRQYWLDGVTVESDLIESLGDFADTPYFDGNLSPAPAGSISAWEGSANISSSVQYSPRVDSTTPLVPAYQTVQFADTEWGGLVPGDNAVQPGWDAPLTGAVFQVRWRHTWL